jgi:hypothetical protein
MIFITIITIIILLLTTAMLSKRGFPYGRKFRMRPAVSG